MGLIFFLSNQSTLVDVESEINEKLIYKSAHIFAYAVLAWLWWRCLSPDRQVTWPVLAWTLGLATLYAISDEIHQRYIPGRHGQLADVLFDVAGALAVVLWLRLFEWPRRFPERASLLGSRSGRYTFN
jgi:VanZ family protein